MSFRQCARLVVGLLAVVIALAGGQAFAATETYGYDALGRLIRWVDAQGRTTEYAYDAVGNLLSVTVAAGGTQNPAVTSVSPDSLRRGDTMQVTITGTNLANVTVTTSHAGLTFSNLATSATQVTLSLTAAEAVPLGAQKLVLSLGAASADASITVLPRLPSLAVVPVPIAVPPDNAPRNFTLSLSQADTVSHTVALSLAPAATATVSPATLTFLAGETAKTVQVSGKVAGNATLTLSSASLATLLVPVFVTAEFQGINTTYAVPVGVQVGSSTATLIPGTLGSENVGVTVGPFVRGITPDRVQVATTATVTFDGAGIPANATAAIAPADGVTLGPLSVAADGSRASLDVTAAASAPTTLRKLALSAAGAPLPLARPDADQLRIVLPTPEITAIAPINGVRGTTISTFTVFGRNLTGATAVQFLGGSGVTSGSSPTVSADGTALTTSVAIGLLATLGPRTVVVQTLSGDSDSAATPANTFTVADQNVATLGPIASPLVGVNVAQPAAQEPRGLSSAEVGVAVGPVITAVSPRTAAQGQQVTVVLAGKGFIAPASATFTPATGLTVGAASVAADGASISVPLTVDSAAPLGTRVLQAVAGGITLPFASPALNQFLITAPRPEIFSIDPSTAAPGGAPFTLTLRGINFQNASQVRVTPADGVSVGTPTANAAGDTVTVSISISAAAATGPRVVTVVTPAGESDATPSPSNTLNLLAGSVFSVTPLASAVVGVQVGQPPVNVLAGTLPAPLVGVQVGTPSVEQIPGTLASAAVGITIGPVATAFSPLGFVRGATNTLSITGLALPADTAITLNPATGLTLGTIQVAPDGASASVAITAAVDAPLGARGVSLARAGPPVAPITFVSPSVPAIFVSPGAPSVESLQPINGRQGETIALVIRGDRFHDLVAVTIEPAAGVVFDNQPVVSADRKQIDLRMRINTDAPQGARVIRVTTQGGQSSAAPAPANTFTIFPP